MAAFQVPSVHPKAFLGIMLSQLALYGLAAGWVIRRKPNARWALGIVALIALAARVAFAVSPPVASDDIYRYVWDGRVQSHHINPYRYASNDPALAQYQDQAIYSHMNRKGAHTIYPPVAQMVFRVSYLLHPDSVTWTKLAFTMIDLLSIGVLAGLLMRLEFRPERSLLYAWHPLLILELGNSGHVDVVAVLFLLLAVRARVSRRFVWTGVLLACATLVKFYAVVALPVLLPPERRRDPRLPIALLTTTLLAYLPFLSVGTAVLGYLPTYISEEGIASGQRFYLLQQVERLAGLLQLGWPGWFGGTWSTATERYQVFLVAAMLVLGLGCWLWPLRVDRDIANRGLLLFVVLLILSSPAYPWYTLLALCLVPLARRRLLLPATVVIGSAFMLYLHSWWPGHPNWPIDIGHGAGAASLALTGIWTILREAHRYGRRSQHFASRISLGEG
jgi:hypothetical protein